MTESQNRNSAENGMSEEREKQNQGLAKAWSLRNFAAMLRTDFMAQRFLRQFNKISTLSKRGKLEKKMHVPPAGAEDVTKALQELGLQRYISLELDTPNEVVEIQTGGKLTAEQVEARRAVKGYRWINRPDKDKKDDFLLGITTLIQKSEASLDSLVSDNRGLAAELAKKYRSAKFTPDDVEAIGNVGLVIAAQQFDWRKGTHFASYATALIRGEILHAFRDVANAIPPPRDIFEDNPRIRKAADLLLHAGQPITVATIAAQLKEIGVKDVSEESIKDVFIYEEQARTPDSFSRVVSSTGRPMTLEDTISDGTDFTQRVDDKIMAEMLTNSTWASSLIPNPLHRQALELFYIHGLNQTEIGAILGVSQQHASRIVRNTVTEIRKHIE